MTTHLEQSMQRDLDRLRDTISQMAALAKGAVRDCIAAFTDMRHQSAYRVILRDQYIDQRENELDRLCLEFLVRHQPAGEPLRFAYSSFKVNMELEIIGDRAAGIARQSLKLQAPISAPVLARFQDLATLVTTMLDDAVTAFLTKDAGLARKTMEQEDAADTLKSSVIADLVTEFQAGSMPFPILNAQMMIARHLEQISDRARDICIEALYVCTGEQARHAQADVFRVLFVDEHDACRSQMAVAVANSMGLQRFVFESAGLEPRALDPAMTRFMKERGFDLSRAVPKPLHQVPDLDLYRTVVCLAHPARHAFPRDAHKLVFLDWHVADPALATGTAEQVHAAYEETFAFIDRHVRELVDAIVGSAEPTKGT